MLKRRMNLKRNVAVRDWKKLPEVKLYNLCSTSDVIEIIKPSVSGEAGNINTRGIKLEYIAFSEKPEDNLHYYI
jgi:hypothetical protein